MIRCINDMMNIGNILIDTSGGFMVEYLKYIKEFLRYNREMYGEAPFGLSMPYNKMAFYGMVEDDLGICDNNSLYLLYNFNKRNLSKPAFKPAKDLGNMDDFYYDVLDYIQQYDLLPCESLEALNEEQKKFYQGFLGKESSMYMTESGILVGESAKGRAFVYTNKGKINE